MIMVSSATLLWYGNRMFATHIDKDSESIAREYYSFKYIYYSNNAICTYYK